MDKIRKKINRGFTIVYNDFIDSVGIINKSEKLLLVVLMRYADEKGKAFPSLVTLAEKTGMSKSSVRRTINSLIDKEILVKENRKSDRDEYTSNLYTIKDTPALWKYGEDNTSTDADELERMAEMLKAAGYTVTAPSPAPELKVVPETADKKNPSSEIPPSENGDRTAKSHSATYNSSKNTTDDADCQASDEDSPQKNYAADTAAVVESETEEEYSMEYIKDMCDYDILLEEHPGREELLDNVLSVMHDTLNSKKKHIRICGEEKPARVVKSKLLKLNYDCIEYVMDTYENQTDRIKAPIPWLRTVLYLSKEQLHLDYTNRVAHDFYNNKPPDSSKPPE